MFRFGAHGLVGPGRLFSHCSGAARVKTAAFGLSNRFAQFVQRSCHPWCRSTYVVLSALAKSHVRMQWARPRKEEAEEYVFGTDAPHLVRECVRWLKDEMGITLRFDCKKMAQRVVGLMVGDRAPGLRPGDVVVRVDERDYRQRRGRFYREIPRMRSESLHGCGSSRCEKCARRWWRCSGRRSGGVWIGRPTTELECDRRGTGNGARAGWLLAVFQIRIRLCATCGSGSCAVCSGRHFVGRQIGTGRRYAASGAELCGEQRMVQSPWPGRLLTVAVIRAGGPGCELEEG